jgi:leucine-rich repeat protein SHOC2
MKLRLDAQALERLPEPVEIPMAITEFNAGFNKLCSLPPSLTTYRNLRTLHLNHNLFEDLPEELATLTELRELDLSSNPLRCFPRVLLRMPHLEVLHLDQTGLEEIPSEFQPGALVHLSLARNKITSIPDTLFSQGSSLRVLRLQQNRLKGLPASMAGLDAIEELDLSYNELESLPDELGQLKRLKLFDLQGNRLRTLPRTVGQLTALLRLTLHENQLTALPDSIGQLASLERLDASHNALRALPEAIDCWRAMHWPVLSENQLTSLAAQCPVAGKTVHWGEEAGGGNRTGVRALETISVVFSGEFDLNCQANSLHHLSRPPNPCLSGRVPPRSHR